MQQQQQAQLGSNLAIPEKYTVYLLSQLDRLVAINKELAEGFQKLQAEYDDLKAKYETPREEKVIDLKKT